MSNKYLSIILTALLGVAIFFFIITISISLPIYLRFFYYLQIDALNIPESSGYDYATIKTAFDQVMNYLTLPGFKFGTGELSYSKEGMAHFADCKALFNLNLSILIISTVIIVTLLVLNKFKVITLMRPFKMHVCFTSAISVLGIFLILGLIIAIDFKSAFLVFHKLFFVGKDNWTFYPEQDPIINILPEQFFMNCAILIVVAIVLICAGIILFQAIKRHKKAKNEEIIEIVLTEDKK